MYVCVRECSLYDSTYFRCGSLAFEEGGIVGREGILVILSEVRCSMAHAAYEDDRSETGHQIIHVVEFTVTRYTL